LLPIFEKVIAIHDQYGLHAFLTALENAGLQASLVAELKNNTRNSKNNESLLEVLESAKLSTEPRPPEENILVKAAAQS
jgi:ABC-type lipoprotein export system ATPase subunit